MNKIAIKALTLGSVVGTSFVLLASRVRAATFDALTNETTTILADFRTAAITIVVSLAVTGIMVVLGGYVARALRRLAAKGTGVSV